MPSIGQILREARDKKGASISEVSHATRIKIDYLEKMESDQFDRIIAPAYAKSFLRMYSEYLGLNPAEMLDLLRSWQPSKSPPAVPTPVQRPRKPAMPSSSPPPTRAKAEPHPTQARPAKPSAPPREAIRETTSPISGTKGVSDLKVTPSLERPAQSAPSQPSSATPAKPVLRLREEAKKPSSPPSVSISRPHSFPLNAMLVVIVVITVSLTAIVWLWQRTRRAPTEPATIELNAKETLRSTPGRAADVLPLPPSP